MISLSFLTHPTADQLRQITALYHIQGWMTEQEIDDPDLTHHIISGSHCFMIATDGDEIVGMGRCISDRISDVYIQDVMVKESHRGQGIGIRIVRTLTERLHADGMKWIGLIAEQGSEEFYKKIGFEKMPNALPMIYKCQLGIRNFSF